MLVLFKQQSWKRSFPTQLQVIQHAQADQPSGLAAALTWSRILHIWCIFYLFEGQQISYMVEYAYEQEAWRRAQGSLTQGDYDARDKHDSSQDDPGGAQGLIVCRGQNGSGLH